ncbi:MAG: GAF domain-containing protein, partial [Calditrichaeota bacterium]
MDILKPKLNKPLLYLFKLGIYTSLYGIIRYIVFRLPTDNADVYAFILTIAIIIFNRGKLTHILQQFIDRQFYRTFYNLKQELLKLNQELPSYMEPDELIQRIKTFLDHHFLPEDYRFYILKGDQFNQVHRSGESSNRFPVRLNIESSGECWKALPSGTYMFSIDTLEAISPQCSEFIRSLGENNPYTYLVPLNGAKGMNGFILFSDKILALTQVEELRELLERVFQKTGQLLENALIHAAIKRKSLESEILLDIVGKITSSLNLQQVLESIVDNLSKLVQYDAAAIFLVDKERKILQQVVTRGYDEARMQTLTLKLDQGISGEVIRTQTGVIIPDVRKDPHYFAAREKTLSQITVPIVHRGNAIGALVLESDQLEHFTREDLELLTFFSGLAAIAIRNAQLYEDSVKKKRLESELVVASRVQKALLPRRVPVVQGIEMDFVNIPSLIVGGDFYDIFKINEQCQGIAIGDVSGKGAPAALLMAVVYAGFKSLLKEIDPVVTVVAR